DQDPRDLKQPNYDQNGSRSSDQRAQSADVAYRPVGGKGNSADGRRVVRGGDVPAACAARRAAAMKFDLPSQSGLTDSLTVPKTASEARTRSADEAGLSPRAFPAAVSPGSSGDRVGSIGRRSVAENAADLGVIGAVEAKSAVEGVVGSSGALCGFDVT